MHLRERAVSKQRRGSQLRSRPGLPYTIVKPCGLTDDPPLKRELLVGHDDELKVDPPLVRSLWGPAAQRK